MLFIIIQLILRIIPLKRFLTVNSEIILLELYLKRMKHRFEHLIE